MVKIRISTVKCKNCSAFLFAKIDADGEYFSVNHCTDLLPKNKPIYCMGVVCATLTFSGKSHL